MRLEADDIRDLQPVIAAAVRATLEAMQTADARLPKERLGFREAEAAALIGVPKHVLRDARRRGEVHARRVGKAFVYSRATLLAWLQGD